jgi:hypothetical protein
MSNLISHRCVCFGLVLGMAAGFHSFRSEMFIGTR